MSLNTLPHDIKHLLLLLAAAEISYSTLRALSNSNRSLYDSYQASLPSLVSAALPRIEPDDYKTIRHLANYLFSLNAFGLLWFGSEQTGGGEARVVPVSHAQWVDALVEFVGTDMPSPPSGNVTQVHIYWHVFSRNRKNRILSVISNSHSLSAYELLFELTERVVVAASDSQLSFPAPRKKPLSSYYHCKFVIGPHHDNKKWKWIGGLMGMHDLQGCTKWMVVSGDGEASVKAKRNKFRNWWKRRFLHRHALYQREKQKSEGAFV